MAQAKAQWVHARMTGRAHAVAAMQLQLLAQRGTRRDGLLVERRHVGRGRRGRGAQEVLQDLLAPDHGRRPRRIAGDAQHAGVAQDSATLAGRERDAAELGTLDAVDAVVLALGGLFQRDGKRSRSPRTALRSVAPSIARQPGGSAVLLSSTVYAWSR